MLGTLPSFIFGRDMTVFIHQNPQNYILNGVSRCKLYPKKRKRKKNPVASYNYVIWTPPCFPNSSYPVLSSVFQEQLALLHLRARLIHSSGLINKTSLPQGGRGSLASSPWSPLCWSQLPPPSWTSPSNSPHLGSTVWDHKLHESSAAISEDKLGLC